MSDLFTIDRAGRVLDASTQLEFTPGAIARAIVIARKRVEEAHEASRVARGEHARAIEAHAAQTDRMPAARAAFDAALRDAGARLTDLFVVARDIGVDIADRYAQASRGLNDVAGVRVFFDRVIEAHAQRATDHVATAARHEQRAAELSADVGTLEAERERLFAALGLPT